jgi:DnaK suppressor protein
MNKNKLAERERYQVLKALLEERRHEIQMKLRSLRETLPADATVVKDAEEQSVDDFVQDIDFALMQMKSETLGRIDQAIQRLESGTYGLCDECGEEIAAARLKALPFAALCRSCQEEQESRSQAVREARAFERFQREVLPSLR